MGDPKDEAKDLPKRSEVDKHLPEGHVAAREQKGRPQSLQGLTDTQGHQFPVVISTGRTHHDERLMEAELAANPPQDWVPAQDPTPPQAGDTLPVDPVTGQLSFQGGAAHILSPAVPVVAGGDQVVVGAGAEVAEVKKAPSTDARTERSGRK